MTLSLATLMAPAPGQKGGMSLLMLQLLLIGMVFYFLILRPQSQARKKHTQMLGTLKKGDDVITTGGLMGKVRDIKDDRVTLESGTSTVVVHRSRIIQVGESAPPNLPA